MKTEHEGVKGSDPTPEPGTTPFPSEVRNLTEQRDALAEALRLFFKVNEAGIERGTTLGEQLAIAGFFDKARAALARIEKGAPQG